MALFASAQVALVLSIVLATTVALCRFKLTAAWTDRLLASRWLFGISACVSSVAMWGLDGRWQFVSANGCALALLLCSVPPIARWISAPYQPPAVVVKE